MPRILSTTATETWVTPSITTGSSDKLVTFHASSWYGRKETGNVREASFIVTSQSDANMSCTISATQTGRPLYISFDERSYGVSATETTVTVTGKTNAKAIAIYSNINEQTLPVVHQNRYTPVIGGVVGSTVQNVPTNPRYFRGPDGDPGRSEEWGFRYTVTFPANTTQDTLRSILTAYAIGDDVNVTPANSTAEVTQSASDAYLWVSEEEQTTESIEFTWNPSDANVQILSNGSWIINEEPEE